MLNIFDWIRQSRNGAELIATLNYFQNYSSDLFQEQEAISSPISLFNRPCKRCWLYYCQNNLNISYCTTCMEIISRAKSLGHQSRQSIVVWGHLANLPKQLESKTGFYRNHIHGSYIHDAYHFMIVMNRLKLKLWIQELLIYHGTDIKGLIQIFPTIANTRRGSMGDIICRAIHQDSRFSMDMLRIRFFSNAYQLFIPHVRDQKGLLTFEVRDFLKLLEMASIFRSLLLPEDQQILRNLTNLKNKSEEQFLWGRLTRNLSAEAKDMLNAWKFRQWTKNQIALFYELFDYVKYTS